MLTTREQSNALGLVLCCLLSACSLAIDPDQKQCKDTEDCQAPYECTSGFCEAKKCAADDECRQPGICGASGRCEKVQCVDQDGCGDDELCNTQTGRCVNTVEAVCSEKTPEQCKVYAGAQVCRKSDGRCVEFECEKASDCGSSPTVICNKGSCEDPKWGCLRQEDPRPAQNMSAVGSLEVPVIHVFPKTGEIETGVNDLSVRVCPFNQACTQSVTDDYSYVDRLLKIEGLENGKNYSVHLTATHPIDLGKPLLDVEYQMYRTVVGRTVEPRPIVMFDDGFRAATAKTAEVTADPALGVVLAYVLDCEDHEVEGVSIAVDKVTLGCGGTDPQCGTTPFYFTASNLPDPGATQTSLAGRLGIANMVTGVLNRLTLTRVADNKVITSFVIAPRENVITYTYFYPQNFGTRAD